MPYVFRQGDLPRLDLQVDRGSDFQAWQAQWESYASLSGLSEESNDKQVKALTLCFSRETLTIVQNLGLNEEERTKVSSVISAIKRYVEGHINESVERRNFRRRSQKSGESFDDFLVSLRELVKTCNFCNDECVQKNLRDQLIEGLSDGDTIEALLQEKDLTLDKAISKCRAQEAAKKQRANLTNDHTETVAAIHKKRHSPPATCPGCGARPHPGGRTQCPAYGISCHNCKKLGHFAKVCRSKPTSEPNRPDTSASANVLLTPNAMLSNIHHVTSTDPAPNVSINITSSNGSTLTKALPDSGADILAAGRGILRLLNENTSNLLPSNIIPKVANGATMHPLGKIPVTFKLKNREYTDDLHIYPSVHGILMSWQVCKGLGILLHCYPDPVSMDVTPSSKGSQPQVFSATIMILNRESVVKEFPTVFDGNIRSMDGEEFHIHLTDDAKLFCVNTPRSIPYVYRDKLATELELLQAQHIIAPITDVTEWCAPIVVAPKKNSDRIRMCVDLSHLNRYVKRERYQSPTPAQAVADIATSNAKFFTVLDAVKGYHQCPLDEQSQLLTTFITPFGRFKYLRAPYGISSISEHYERRMAEAFAGLTGFRRIVDDIVIYDSDITQHVKHVKEFLQRCSEKKISLNLDKCKFCQTQVTFAGFVLSAEGYQVDQSITNAISEFHTPANRTDLCSFLAWLTNFLPAPIEYLNY